MINLGILQDPVEEEKQDAIGIKHQIDAESVLVKSVHTNRSSAYNQRHEGAKDSTPFSMHKQATMSVYANRSQTQFSTLPHIFRKDREQHDSTLRSGSRSNNRSGENKSGANDPPLPHHNQSSALLDSRTQVIELCDHYEYFSDNNSEVGGDNNGDE